MKTETTSIKSTRGRPVGFKMPSTIKKEALKTLAQIMMDTSASAEARAIAASKLVDEIKG